MQDMSISNGPKGHRGGNWLASKINSRKRRLKDTRSFISEPYGGYKRNNFGSYVISTWEDRLRRDKIKIRKEVND